MTTVNFNDNRENPVQTLLGVLLYAAAALVLFGIVPGFFIASLVDFATPLKAGPIWAISLLSTVLIIYIVIKRTNEGTRKALLRYTGFAAILAGVLIVLALFTQGDIFFGYTAKKMFSFLNNKRVEKSFQEVELQRGRLIYPPMTFDKLMAIANSNQPENDLKSMGFVPFKDSTNGNFEREILNDEFSILGQGFFQYNSTQKSDINALENALVRDGFTLDKENSTQYTSTYAKGNKSAWVGLERMKENKQWYSVQIKNE